MKTIEDLIEALESGKYLKTKGQFSKEVGPYCNAYCCLGVYAKINDMKYSPDQGVFPWDGNGYLFLGKRTLDPDHWLVERIHLASETFSQDGRDVQLQSFLTDVNDATDDFGGVLAVLKDFRDGQRIFDADNYVKETADV